MLSIPPGWYLLRPKDVVVRYWNGSEFTNDFAPLGNGRYSSLTSSALRKWHKMEKRARKSAKKNPPKEIPRGKAVPEGYAG